MLSTPDTILHTSELDQVIASAHAVLAERQGADGHWVFELEADATIPAEYILLEHYLDRIDAPLQQRLGRYLRRIQNAEGGWPLYHDGRTDLSASVKAYFALKAIGDDPDAPHMRLAREAILARGGAERANVFCRFQLALFGEIPWRGVPVMPIELMLMPRWFFFNIWNMSYWSRVVVAPLLVLATHQPRARNPHGVHVPELFRTPPEQVRDWNHGPDRSAWGRVFKRIDSILRVVDPYTPSLLRRAAQRRAVGFVEQRLNGIDGLGAIYPAMANSIMMFDVLGVPADAPAPAMAWQSVRNLLVDHGEESYCQPCVSPIWDTGLAGHAMLEAASGIATLARGEATADTEARMESAAAWLRDRQVLDVKGDWAVQRPYLEPGGWAFQYRNDYYPDVDDTAVVGMLLHRQGDSANGMALQRARAWIVGMQSSNGGWGAFDVDNNHDVLNHIPFADHGALLDPPTADVAARCVSFLAQLGHADDAPVIARGLNYLRREQEPDGSWFGRWGTNYIYGTWSVLCALNAAGVDPRDGAVRRAVDWLASVQRDDGGWGEGCASFEGATPGFYTESLPSQTAWAILGLMAAGERDHPATARGVAFLMRTQTDGEWEEIPYNAVGFPKVFYLRYHGYRQFFPLMALARYRNLGHGNSRRVSYGF